VFRDGEPEKGYVGSVVGEAGSGVVPRAFGLNIPEGADRHRFPVAYAFRELAVNAEPGRVRRYAENSLGRLGGDAIDLYYLHFPDPQVPIEDTAGAVADLIAAGQVRHFGVCT
jgi:aryl-alcohol dehydrogenase-like predicted oxidoreductase